MPTLGVTGGVASGKTAFCRLLKQYGATVFSADEAARAVVSPGGAVLREIAREFGPDILRPDGTLNRAALGKRIFADPEARLCLERITHPPIRNLLRAQIETEKYESAANTLIVVEVPLLFESNLSSWFDRIAVVDASETIQIKRLRRRNGFDEAEARRRLAAQWPIEQKKTRADYILENNGAPDALENAAREILERLDAEFSTGSEKKKPRQAE